MLQMKATCRFYATDTQERGSNAAWQLFTVLCVFMLVLLHTTQCSALVSVHVVPEASNASCAVARRKANANFALNETCCYILSWLFKEEVPPFVHCR
jgi:hypothetical protein